MVSLLGLSKGSSVGVLWNQHKSSGGDMCSLDDQAFRLQSIFLGPEADTIVTYSH